MISGDFGLLQSEVDTRLFAGVGKVDFRRIESLISRPRTGQKEQNIEFQSGSVVYFGVGRPGWRAVGNEGCRMHIFRMKNAHGAHLVENYSGIGKLVAKQFGHECREPKKVTEHV